MINITLCHIAKMLHKDLCKSIRRWTGWVGTIFEDARHLINAKKLFPTTASNVMRGFRSSHWMLCRWTDGYLEWLTVAISSTCEWTSVFFMFVHILQCSSTFNPWYTFAFAMKPPSTKIEETRITCKKIKISLLDNSTNKKLLEKLKSKKFNYSVLAFLECRYYVQNLVIWQKESPVSQICVIPFSNFGSWITFGPLSD